MIGLLFIGLFVIAAVAWHFIPAIKERVKGWTTILEGIGGTALYYFGAISDAVQEAQKAGYIPSQWLGYVPYILMAWVLVKRLTTTEPVPIVKKK
jgi:hypothetical protein